MGGGGEEHYEAGGGSRLEWEGGGEGRLCNYLAAEAAVFPSPSLFHFLKGREVGVVGRRGERRNLQRFFAL